MTNYYRRKSEKHAATAVLLGWIGMVLMALALAGRAYS